MVDSSPPNKCAKHSPRDALTRTSGDDWPLTHSSQARVTDQNDRRKAAVRRLKAKRAFAMQAALFVLVNILLVAVWAWTGRGYFWPMWPFFGWGIGRAFFGWSVYFRTPISEDDIRREMEKGG